MKAALLPDRGVVKVAGEDARKFLNGLITADAGKVTPVIDRIYPLSQTAAAMDYVGTGHARGKVVISV